MDEKANKPSKAATAKKVKTNNVIQKKPAAPKVSKRRPARQ